MRKIKKTKIVATLGPASSSRETMKEMMLSGVNVFRINFSHADYEDVLGRIQIIRDLNPSRPSRSQTSRWKNGPRHTCGDRSGSAFHNSKDR